MLKSIRFASLLALVILGTTVGAEARRHPHQRSVSVSGLVPSLREKVNEIVADCGSVVVSAVSRRYVAGTGHLSLHASGRAADLEGNPTCIYAHLKGWTSNGGGYSTDYGSVGHVHISHGGREAGLAFTHHGHRHASRGGRPGGTQYAAFGNLDRHAVH